MPTDPMTRDEYDRWWSRIDDETINHSLPEPERTLALHVLALQDRIDQLLEPDEHDRSHARGCRCYLSQCACAYDHPDAVCSVHAAAVRHAQPEGASRDHGHQHAPGTPPHSHGSRGQVSASLSTESAEPVPARGSGYTEAQRGAETVLRPNTGDGRSHTCMHCGTTTPDSAFCDHCGGVYCDNHLTSSKHYCRSQP